jgi:hypothetical protein
MGGSSSPTVKDSLTGGQEQIDRLLFRMLSGLPMPGMPEDLAKQLGLPPGTAFPNPFGNSQQQYKPGDVVQGAGQPNLGATPWMQAGPIPNDPNFMGPQVPSSVYRDVNAPINQTLLNAMQASQGLNPSQGVAEQLAALQNALSGKKAFDFKPLQGPSQLNLNNLAAMPNLKLDKANAPGALNMQQYGAAPKVNAERIKPDLSYKYDPFKAQNVNTGVGQATNKYNYQPGSVKSTLDNANNTQKYFEKGVMNPLLRQFDQAIAPRIADTAASLGNTFSTRTQVARQNALEGLQGTAAAELSRAVREDEIERSQQNLNAQQFNVGTQTQNAQFGGELQQGYDLANMQRALQIAGMNQQGQQFQHSANTAGAFNQSQLLNNLIMQSGQLNNQNNFQAAGINNQAQQFAQNLNSQNALQQYGLNSQNALNFADLNQRGQLGAFNANVANQLGFGQLNTQRQLGAADLNSRNQFNYDQLNTNTQMALGENAANRQLQGVGMLGDVYNNQFNRTAQQLQMGSGIQQMNQGRSEREFQEFMRNAPENNPWLQMMMQYRGIPSNPIAFQNPSLMSQIGQGMGIGMGGLSMLPMLGGAASAAGGLASGIGGLGAGALGLLGLLI